MKYRLLWLLGIPISILIIAFLIFHYQLNSSFLV